MTVPTTNDTTTSNSDPEPATRGTQFTPPCDPPCIQDDPCLDGFTQWHFLPCDTTTTLTVSQQLPATGGGSILPASLILLCGLVVCSVARRRSHRF